MTPRESFRAALDHDAPHHRVCSRREHIIKSVRNFAFGAGEVHFADREAEAHRMIRPSAQL
ncbi:MAG: hypothetical protein QGH20_00775, partial [Candidatus Latescibacteria bacterium]|nr:hypothetical protein [Candidatus Latescibacterota bacterium]